MLYKANVYKIYKVKSIQKFISRGLSKLVIKFNQYYYL